MAGALVILTHVTEAAIPRPSDPFQPVEAVIAVATWGEQKAEADGISINSYGDEESGVYFGLLFGTRSAQTDYEHDTNYDYIHTSYLPDGSAMSWWQESDATWGKTERDYSYRITRDNNETVYYYFWDTTYRIFSDYSRSGTNPPDPMPSTFRVTATCQIADVDYVEGEGLQITPRPNPDNFYYYLSAQEDDYTDQDILGFGEEMLKSETSGLWRRYWARRDLTAAELALVTDFTAKLRAKTKGKPYEAEEKRGQD